ncbi:MAG TPA: hypothetical protein PKM27_06775 [Saprospiraceae bacterium]|nr:hypothetical protein [Saprospiraceae bacterium]
MSSVISVRSLSFAHGGKESTEHSYYNHQIFNIISVASVISVRTISV